MTPEFEQAKGRIEVFFHAIINLKRDKTKISPLSAIKPNKGDNMSIAFCTEQGCSKKHLARGYCVAHYTLHRRHGDIETNGLTNSSKTHGMWGTPTYHCWNSMLQRCSNKKDTAYHHYGGRGIKVCDRWQNSFENFYEDMGQRPEGLTIDRINNEGNYEPSNCRWASMQVQGLNQRRFKTNTSGFTGVYKSGKKWLASITIDDKLVRLGIWDTPEKANRAYLKAKEARMRELLA